jgi:hypothetical protein
LQLADFAAIAAGRPAEYADTMPTIRHALHVQHVLDTAVRATGQRLPIPRIPG